MLSKLPETIEVIERGWLSSNNILAYDGDLATLVDSGYISHVEQTLSLIADALGRRKLTRLINTHSHSDHIGGNAALKREFDCKIYIPAGIEESVRRWDEQALLLSVAKQKGERFIHDGVICPGDKFTMGELLWHAYAAPGHDMDALVYFCPSEGILISGDALWQDGFGIIFAEILGLGDGVAATRATLDLLSSLSVKVVIPGHGKVFTDVNQALERAYQRLAAFTSNPERMTKNAIKACFTFNLLEMEKIPLADLTKYLSSVPFFIRTAENNLGLNVTQLAEFLIQDLQRNRAIEIKDGNIIPLMAA